MKKFKRFREQNPNDPLVKEYKALGRRARASEPAMKKLMEKYTSLHAPPSMSKVLTEVHTECDTTEKAEHKFNWPSICFKYQLKADHEDTFATIQKYEKMGWVRTVI